MITIFGLRRKQASICKCGGQATFLPGRPRWAIFDDLRPCCDTCCTIEHGDIAGILANLNSELPSDRFDSVGFVVGAPEIFATQGVCDIGVGLEQGCQEKLQPRPILEITTALPNSGRTAAGKCPRCLARYFPEVDAFLHELNKSTPPEPLPAPAPHVPSKEAVRAARRERIRFKIACSLALLDENRKRIAPGDAAVRMMEAIDLMMEAKCSATLPPSTIPAEQRTALATKMDAALKAKLVERGGQLVDAVADVVAAVSHAEHDARMARRPLAAIKREFYKTVALLMPFFCGDRKAVREFLIAHGGCTIVIPSVARIQSMLAEEKINADFAAEQK